MSVEFMIMFVHSEMNSSGSGSHSISYGLFQVIRLTDRVSSDATTTKKTTEEQLIGELKLQQKQDVYSGSVEGELWMRYFTSMPMPKEE